MKNNTKIALVVIIVLGASILGTYAGNDYLHHIQTPSITLSKYEICNAECAQNFEKTYPYKCAEVEYDTFVCRQERGQEQFVGNKGFGGTFPTTYGEIVAFSEGEYEHAFFDIAAIKILDKDSKKIMVYFAAYTNSAKVVHIAHIEPGDTFLTGCTDNMDVVHLIQYVDMYDLNNDTYVELWGTHPSVPPELIPCNLATIVESSLLTDYDVRLPDYEDFGFDSDVP